MDRTDITPYRKVIYENACHLDLTKRKSWNNDGGKYIIS